MGIDQREMSWRQFEMFVEDAIGRAVDEMRWRVIAQREKPYTTPGGDTVNKRLDLHIAERRQGGRSIVIDAKHYKKTDLNRQQIDSVEEYRRLCRASLGLLTVSEVTNIPRSVYDYIDKHSRIELMFVNGEFEENIVDLIEEFSG